MISAWVKTNGELVDATWALRLATRAEQPAIVSSDKPYLCPKTPPFAHGPHPSGAYERVFTFQACATSLVRLPACKPAWAPLHGHLRSASFVVRIAIGCRASGSPVAPLIRNFSFRASFLQCPQAYTELALRTLLESAEGLGRRNGTMRATTTAFLRVLRRSWCFAWWPECELVGGQQRRPYDDGTPSVICNERAFLVFWGGLRRGSKVVRVPCMLLQSERKLDGNWCLI